MIPLKVLKQKVLKQVFGLTAVKQEASIFDLQPEHPAYHLDGCTVTLTAVNSLSFQFQKPGNSIVVLKTKAPLIITEQKGLTARLRPGWDGTLGYSLYALDS